jgi:hypothetical protein
MSLSPSSDTRQATEPKYTVSARLVTIRNIRESRLISATPQLSNFEAAAASFAESENADTLTKANFSPRAARPRRDVQLIGRRATPSKFACYLCPEARRRRISATRKALGPVRWIESTVTNGLPSSISNHSYLPAGSSRSSSSRAYLNIGEAANSGCIGIQSKTTFTFRDRSASTWFRRTSAARSA